MSRTGGVAPQKRQTMFVAGVVMTLMVTVAV
jgi:hypothetical protein